MTRQQAASISGLSPAFIAAEDYRMGGGQDDNPYQDGTAEHEQYAFHMHKLWADEFHADQQQAKHGGVPS